MPLKCLLSPHPSPLFAVGLVSCSDCHQERLIPILSCPHSKIPEMGQDWPNLDQVSSPESASYSQHRCTAGGLWRPPTVSGHHPEEAENTLSWALTPLYIRYKANYN